MVIHTSVTYMACLWYVLSVVLVSKWYMFGSPVSVWDQLLLRGK